MVRFILIAASSQVLRLFANFIESAKRIWRDGAAAVVVGALDAPAFAACASADFEGLRCVDMSDWLDARITSAPVYYKSCAYSLLVHSKPVMIHRALTHAKNGATVQSADFASHRARRTITALDKSETRKIHALLHLHSRVANVLVTALRFMLDFFCIARTAVLNCIEGGWRRAELA